MKKFVSTVSILASKSRTRKHMRKALARQESARRVTAAFWQAEETLRRAAIVANLAAVTAEYDRLHADARRLRAMRAESGALYVNPERADDCATVELT